MEANGISPAKTLSRKPFMLMLQDESGDLHPIRLDAGLVLGDKALIVLDEYRDTCWVWIGRDVSMPTRMHALRMGKSVQKAGYKIGVTTIGLASSKLVEMHQKDDSDAEVANNIAAFKEALSASWKFEDEFLAFDPRLFSSSTAPIAGAPVEKQYEAPRASRPPEPRLEPRPAVTARPAPAVRVLEGKGAKKTAFLLYATVKNADLVYTERFEKDGKTGYKIEVPGTMVIEAVVDGDNLVIRPANFGDTEGAQAIKTEYEGWLVKI